MKRERNTVGGDSSSEPFLWCLVCNCSKKTLSRTSPSEISHSADCLSIPFLLATHNPQAPLTTKKITNIIWRISHFHFWSAIIFPSVCGCLTLIQSGKNRGKWKQAYVFFLLVSRCSTAAICVWSEMDWSTLKINWYLKENNILIIS